MTGCVATSAEGDCCYSGHEEGKRTGDLQVATSRAQQRPTFLSRG